MKKLLIGAALATAVAAAPVGPASADTGLTGAALTTVAAVAGAAAGVVLLPYAMPTAGPAVASAYTATATAVNSALVGLGGVVVAQPMVAGAVIGMGAGIVVGSYLFQ